MKITLTLPIRASEDVFTLSGGYSKIYISIDEFDPDQIFESEEYDVFVKELSGNSAKGLLDSLIDNLSSFEKEKLIEKLSS